MPSGRLPDRPRRTEVGQTKSSAPNGARASRAAASVMASPEVAKMMTAPIELSAPSSKDLARQGNIRSTFDCSILISRPSRIVPWALRIASCAASTVWRVLLVEHREPHEIAYFELYQSEWVSVLVEFDLDIVCTIGIEDRVTSKLQLILGELAR